MSKIINRQILLVSMLHKLNMRATKSNNGQKATLTNCHVKVGQKIPCPSTNPDLLPRLLCRKISVIIDKRLQCKVVYNQRVSIFYMHKTKLGFVRVVMIQTPPNRL